MITLNLTEIGNHAEVGTKIAKEFTKFCVDEKHNCPEKYVYHEVHYADEPKSLNYYGTSAHIPFLQPPVSGKISYHSRARGTSDPKTVSSRVARPICF
jgi:hypothetical protein